MPSRVGSIALVLVCAMAGACASPTPAVIDAAVDTGADVPGTDVARDTASSDAPAEAAMDAALDAPADVASDAAIDTGPVCPHPAEVLVLASADWQTVAQGLFANPSPCADYYVSVAPQDADRTLLRGAVEPTRIRDLGLRMHALAVFDWSAFAAVTGSTWYDRGTSFRRQVAEAGYNVVDGDTWLVANVPVTFLGTADGRQALRDAMRGLYTGPMGSATVQGGVVLSGPDYTATDVTAYRTALEALLADSAFWTDAGMYTHWLGETVPPLPPGVCVAGASLDARTAAINAYAEHLPRLAGAMGAPATVTTAQAYLARGYVPVLDAQWDGTTFTAGAMPGFVSTEVYATRSWADGHAYPGERIGFAWVPPAGVSAADEGTVVAQMAAAVHGAYDAGGGAALQACVPAPPAGCGCTVAGAALPTTWAGFDTW